VDRDIGIRIGVGTGYLICQRKFARQVAARFHDRLCERANSVVVQILPDHQMYRYSQGRQVFLRDWRRTPKRAFRQFVAFEAFGHGGDGFG